VSLGVAWFEEPVELEHDEDGLQRLQALHWQVRPTEPVGRTPVALNGYLATNRPLELRLGIRLVVELGETLDKTLASHHDVLLDAIGELMPNLRGHVLPRIRSLRVPALHVAYLVDQMRTRFPADVADRPRGPGRRLGCAHVDGAGAAPQWRGAGRPHRPGWVGERCRERGVSATTSAAANNARGVPGAGRGVAAAD